MYKLIVMVLFVQLIAGCTVSLKSTSPDGSWISLVYKTKDTLREYQKNRSNLSRAIVHGRCIEEITKKPVFEHASPRVKENATYRLSMADDLENSLGLFDKRIVQLTDLRSGNIDKIYSGTVLYDEIKSDRSTIESLNEKVDYFKAELARKNEIIKSELMRGVSSDADKIVVFDMIACSG